MRSGWCCFGYRNGLKSVPGCAADLHSGCGGNHADDVSDELLVVDDENAHSHADATSLVTGRASCVRE